MSNPKANYYMTEYSGNELIIEETRLERDLGLIVADYLKRSGHVDLMVGKANMILGMLKKTFESRDPGLWKDLYVSTFGVFSSSLESICKETLTKLK